MEISGKPSWHRVVNQLMAADVSFVLVTILNTKGSSPRTSSTKMVVTRDGLYQTIGGGQLEFRAIEKARQLLKAQVTESQIEEFPLGPALNQCCGGHVTLLFEPFFSHGFHVHLFGAGHVALALTKILSELPCKVDWYDPREGVFPLVSAENTVCHSDYQLEPVIESASSHSIFLIMTHSHSLDLQICEAVLSRAEVRYCGLIGSRSKGVRFKNRLRKKGFSQTELDRITCPMGDSEVPGKLPMEIAVSISADLIKRQALRTSATESATLLPLRSGA